MIREKACLLEMISPMPDQETPGTEAFEFDETFDVVDEKSPITSVAEMHAALKPFYRQVVEHEVYHEVSNLNELRVFMENHVFAVWDYMNLLKTLQQQLTCVEVPWLPSADPISRRLINDIVAEEEADLLPNGEYASHFELYLMAMDEAGADSMPIRTFMTLLRDGETMRDALAQCGASTAAKRYVLKTWSMIESAGTAELAAAFLFGREDVLPGCFTHLVNEIAQRLETIGEDDPSLEREQNARLDLYRFYLNRHIETNRRNNALVYDQQAERTLERLCNDEKVFQRAFAAARQTLKARIVLWDSVQAQVQTTDERLLAMDS